MCAQSNVSVVNCLNPSCYGPVIWLFEAQFVVQKSGPDSKTHGSILWVCLPKGTQFRRIVVGAHIWPSLQSFTPPLPIPLSLPIFHLPRRFEGVKVDADQCVKSLMSCIRALRLWHVSLRVFVRVRAYP